MCLIGNKLEMPNVPYGQLTGGGGVSLWVMNGFLNPAAANLMGVEQRNIQTLLKTGVTSETNSIRLLFGFILMVFVKLNSNKTNTQDWSNKREKFQLLPARLII